MTEQALQKRACLFIPCVARPDASTLKDKMSFRENTCQVEMWKNREVMKDCTLYNHTETGNSSTSRDINSKVSVGTFPGDILTSTFLAEHIFEQ